MVTGFFAQVTRVLEKIVDEANDAILNQKYAIANGHYVVRIPALILRPELETFEIGSRQKSF